MIKIADVKWIKIVTDVFDNRKIKQIDRMPEADAILVIWFKILCLSGEINENGFIMLTKDIPYTDEMLATAFNKPVNIIRLALKTYEHFGMIELIDNVYRVSNWEKYQSVDKMEKLKEQTKLRVARHRELKKLPATECNVTVTLPVTQSNATDKTKSKKENKNIYSDYTANNELINAIKSFIEMRNKLKKPMTDRAVEMMLNKLSKLANNDITKIEILNQSIMSSWTDIYPPTQQKLFNKQPQKEELQLL